MKLTTAQPARHSDPTTKASALAYLIFERPDLDQAEQFLNDFGLRTVSRDEALLLLRGTGASHFCYVVRKAPKSRFVGFGLQVDNRADLDALAELPGASGPERSPLPGGGYIVRLTDPSGFRVDAVWGQGPVSTLSHRPPLPFNSVDAAVRINGTQRPPECEIGRAHV